MLPLSRHRILASLLAQRRASIASSSSTRTATAAPSHFADATTRLFHGTTQATADAQPEEPVPIVWTTHRLSQEQIQKVDAIFHKMLWLDIFETSVLTEIINQRLGLTMTPKQRKALQKQIDARASGVAADGGSAKQEAEEEEAGPKLVDLKLTAFDAKAKIKVIKEVRAIAGLGLKEAKELVESAPKVIQKDIAPEEAEELKKKLEEVGATIEVV